MIDVSLLIEVAVAPKAKADWARLSTALAILAQEDSCFRCSVDPASELIILKVFDEVQLEGKVDLLRRVHGLDIIVGTPQVAYRETVTRTVEIDHTHKIQLGAAGQFARVRIRFDPLPSGMGYAFQNDAESVPSTFVSGVECGLNAVRRNGVLAGYPLIDFRATLIEGVFHEVDSSESTFEIAASAALRALKERKAVALLEPMMKVEIVTPEEFLVGVIGALNARRGQVLSADKRSDAEVIVAVVPLVAMLGYSKVLAAMSNKRAELKMAFSHYETALLTDNEPPPYRPAAGKRA